MPPSKQTSKSDLEDLARCLRQERLYVSYERKQLQQLNENVAASGRRLAAIICFFIPSLGLCDLLFHWKAEKINFYLRKLNAKYGLINSSGSH